MNLDKAVILSEDDKELNAKYNEAKAAVKTIVRTAPPAEKPQETPPATSEQTQLDSTTDDDENY